MSGTQIGGLAIEVYDRHGKISRNAQEGKRKMSAEVSLNDNDIKVAHAMGIDPKDVAAVKYAHGKGGLAGVSLHANPPGSEPYPGKRQSSPFPDAPKKFDAAPGGDQAVAPDNSDDDDDGRPEMGAAFPDGTTSRSRRKKRKDA